LVTRSSLVDAREGVEGLGEERGRGEEEKEEERHRDRRDGRLMTNDQ
jgi:hypothetical protein